MIAFGYKQTIFNLDHAVSITLDENESTITLEFIEPRINKTLFYDCREDYEKSRNTLMQLFFNIYKEVK